jgi:drug/metabolite transporter (DMT)-like permease
MAWGQLHIETGTVAIFNASTAVFGALVAAAVLPDERLTARRAAGVALGFSGVVALVGLEAAAGLSVRSLAQLAVAAGALSYAFAAVWARLRLRGLPPEVAAAGMLCCSAAMTAPLAVAFEGRPTLALGPAAWAAVAWCAGLGTAGAYLLYRRVPAVAGAANLALATLMIPPVSIALGAAFPGERLGPEAGFGFAVVAAGLAVVDGRAPGLLRRRRDA